MAYGGWGLEKSLVINCQCVLNAAWIPLVMLLPQAHWNMFIRKDICIWLSCRYLAHLDCHLAWHLGTIWVVLFVTLYNLIKTDCCNYYNIVNCNAWIWLCFVDGSLLYRRAGMIALVVWLIWPAVLFKVCDMMNYSPRKTDIY